MESLLIAGGSRDPNLAWLRDAATRLGVANTCVFTDPDAPPALAWTLGEAAMTVDGLPIACAAAFIRYDVFYGLSSAATGAHTLSGAWFAAMEGYCAVAGLRMLNRRIDPLSASKPAMLALAASCGLPIPPTVISNDEAPLRQRAAAAPAIAKPVAGGSYVTELSAALTGASWKNGRSPSPAIIQPRLDYPERRIFLVGDRFFAFDIGSRTLDSRLDPNGTIAPYPLNQLPAGILDGLLRLTERLSCDFCAVDLKTDPASGELLFLELNNSPMFMGYDKSCGGAMAEHMVRTLMLN